MAPARRRDETATDVPPRPWRILIAADDPDVSELLARVLATDGHQVRRAVSQQAAIVALMNETADCVVAALTRSGPSGNLELLDTIRDADDPRLAATRVVLCGGSGANRLFSWESGVDGFLQHPFYARDLVAEVAAAVERPDEERRAHRRAEADVAQTEVRPGAPTEPPWH